MLFLVVPAAVLELPAVFQTVWRISLDVGLIRSGALMRYTALSLVNGVAFTSYK